MNNIFQTTRNHLRVAAATFVMLLCTGTAFAQEDSLFEADTIDGELQGYTEPFRTIELSSDETGAISKLVVREGDSVQANQVIAKLDDRIQKIQIESAKHQAESRGRFQAAQQTLAKRQKMFDLITDLQKTGGTSKSEAVRASMELSIAEAKVAEAEEEIVDRQMTLKRAKVQLERRWIRAPFSGVVAIVHREEGEFLSPIHPEIITLVQVDQLLATFNIPSSRIDSVRIEQVVTMSLTNGRMIEGVIYSIGVQTDAKSGTIQVKVRIDNAAGNYRSGEQCVLNL